MSVFFFFRSPNGAWNGGIFCVLKKNVPTDVEVHTEMKFIQPMARRLDQEGRAQGGTKPETP